MYLPFSLFSLTVFVLMFQNKVPLSVTVSQKAAPARAARTETTVNPKISRGEVMFFTRLIV